MRDIRQTGKYARYLSTQGWRVEKTRNFYAYIKYIPIIGTIIKIQRPEKLNILQIQHLEKKYKPFQIIIEPKYTAHQLLLTNHGFKEGRSIYLPSKTLHLDLTKSKKFLFNNLKKDARYSIGKTYMRKQTKNTVVVRNPPIEYFRKSWKKAVRFSRHIHTQDQLLTLKNEYKTNSLFLTSHNKQNNKNEHLAVSGAIFLSTGSICYYWQAFNNKVGRSTLTQYRLLWEGILWAKFKGCRVFDFEGIYDKRFPNKSWLGFTHFKKSFGGVAVEYPGVYSKIRIQNLFNTTH